MVDLNRNELWKQINELDKKFEKNKLKRTIQTILFFAAVFFGFAYFCGLLRDQDFLEILGILVSCVFFAGIHVVVNATIFSN